VRQKYRREVVGFATSLQTAQAPSDIRRKARCPPALRAWCSSCRIDVQNVPRIRDRSSLGSGFSGGKRRLGPSFII
jgi:hypothetical protein